MKEFLLIFRSDATAMKEPRSPQQMEDSMKLWMDWIGGIAAQNKLVSRGNRLFHSGAVLRPNNMVTDGPYVETKEALGGYSIINAANLEEATEFSKGCPILMFGGNVEIREIVPM